MRVLLNFRHGSTLRSSDTLLLFILKIHLFLTKSRLISLAVPFPLYCLRAGALFNAVKKQFGLESYLLPLTLPSPPPPPVPVPALIPRLPPPPSSDSPEPSPIDAPPPTPNIPGAPSALNTLRMSDKDIQQTARFTREFLLMSLIPWMEKCVVEWNENAGPFHLTCCLYIH